MATTKELIIFHHTGDMATTIQGIWQPPYRGYGNPYRGYGNHRTGDRAGRNKQTKIVFDCGFSSVDTYVSEVFAVLVWLQTGIHRFYSYAQRTELTKVVLHPGQCTTSRLTQRLRVAETDSESDRKRD